MDEPLRTHAPLEPKHCRAICDEIRERLRQSLARNASPVPPRLRKLLGQFAELQGDAPPILDDRFVVTLISVGVVSVLTIWVIFLF